MNSALLQIHFYETLPESNTRHLWLIMADIESFPRRVKISFADYNGKFDCFLLDLSLRKL